MPTPICFNWHCKTAARLVRAVTSSCSISLRTASGLSAEVFDAVHGLLAGQRLNVSASASDFIGDGAELISSDPAGVGRIRQSQISSFDSTTFYGVVAGTYLTFNIVLDPARVHPTDVVQRNLVRVRLLSSGVASLGYSDVEIDIPPRGMTCSH